LVRTIKRVMIVGLIIFVILSHRSTSIGENNGTTIILDGNMDDWAEINPIIVDEAVNESYWLDVNAVYVTANLTNLFLRFDYESPLGYWDSLVANLTIRTPDQRVFILLCQIIYDVEPHWSFTAIFHGINIHSPYNNNSLDAEGPIAEYQNTVAIDSATNSSIEFSYLLADLNLTITDYIDITAWHYDSIMVGEAVYQGSPIMSQTAYKVYLSGNNTVNTTEPAETTDTSPEKTEGITYFTSLICLTVLFIIKKRRIS